MKRANKKKYPSTASEVLLQLKQNQARRDKHVRSMIQKAIDGIPNRDWPMQFSRLEIKGQEVRAIVVWKCPECFSEGVAHTKEHPGTELPCWHCSQCDTHADFSIISNLR